MAEARDGRDAGNAWRTGDAVKRRESWHAGNAWHARESGLSWNAGDARYVLRRPPLGHVLATAHDVGRAVNPALLRGQLVGAAAQGIGAALLEELPYDETGQPLAVTLADYLLPTAADVPEVETVVIEHPVAGNPLGVKGGGEAGMVTAPAAVANAAAAALKIRRLRQLSQSARFGHGWIIATGRENLR